MSRENPEFLVGDRVVHLEDPSHEGEARNGEQGTIVHLDPADDVISWDVALATTWNVDDGSVGLVPGVPRGSGPGRITRDRIVLKVMGPLPERVVRIAVPIDIRRTAVRCSTR